MTDHKKKRFDKSLKKNSYCVWTNKDTVVRLTFEVVNVVYFSVIFPYRLLEFYASPETICKLRP